MTSSGQPDDLPDADSGIETPRRYWVGVVIVVLAILLVIGFALVTFVASDDTGSTIEGAIPTIATLT